jgi:hypothetical protein
MGKHSNIGPHYYRGLDDGSALEVNIGLREVAERVEDLNYGTQRFLSHLIDVRREALAQRIKTYRDRGDDDVAALVEREGGLLADGIEALLNDGLC